MVMSEPPIDPPSSDLPPRSLAEMIDAAKGHPGVKFDKERRLYVARVFHRGHSKTLGRFDTVEEASAAYRDAKALLDQRKADNLEAKLTTTIDDKGDLVPVNPEAPRRVGLRRDYMGCFYSSELGRYVAKFLEAPDESTIIGTYATLEEADEAHAEYWRMRQENALDRDAKTPEDAILAGCDRYRETGHMDLNRFRWHLIVNSPYTIDLATPFDAYIYDEMLMARAGYDVGFLNGNLVIKFDAQRPIPAQA